MASQNSRTAGVFVATEYAKWFIRVFSGPVASGSPVTLALTSGVAVLPDGRVIVPFAVNSIVNVGSGASAESVTITAFANCYNGAAQGTSTISGNTSNAHGQGDQVTTASGGLFEACVDAVNKGGGVVVIDSSWTGTAANLATARATFPTISIVDNRSTSGEVQQASVTLTSAQLKALQTTAIQIVPAAGTGTLLVPTKLVLRYKYLTAAYTLGNADNKIQLEYVGQTTLLVAPACAGLVDQAVNVSIFQSPAVALAALADSVCANLGLELKLVGTTPALTVGSGTVVATLFYAVVTS